MSNLLRLEAAKFPRTFVVVDALDESSESNGTRMAVLAELKCLDGVANVFVSSRPLPSLAGNFTGKPQLSIRADDKDIRKYISARLHKEPTLSSFLAAEQNLAKEIEDAIVGKVQGMLVLITAPFNLQNCN